MTRQRAEARVVAASRESARKVAAAPAPSRGGRPTKQAAEELGQRILATAAHLFSTQGFAATSMEQVASACGAGKDTIYRRYPSKAALFTALMDQLRASVVAEIEAALEPESVPLDRLKSYARRLLAINLRPDMLALNRVALAEAVPSGGVQAPAARMTPSWCGSPIWSRPRRRRAPRGGRCPLHRRPVALRHLHQADDPRDAGRQPVRGWRRAGQLF